MNNDYKSYDELKLELGKPIYVNSRKINGPKQLENILKNKYIKDKDTFYLLNISMLEGWSSPYESISNKLGIKDIFWIIKMFKNTFKLSFGRPITKTVVYDTGVVVFEIDERR